MSERKKFYKSSSWVNTSKAYAKSVDYLCERCLAKGKYVGGKIVHHKIHLNDSNYLDPSISLNWDNLEYLCQDCHNKEHFEVYDSIVWDDNGNIIDINRKEYDD